MRSSWPWKRPSLPRRTPLLGPKPSQPQSPRGCLGWRAPTPGRMTPCRHHRLPPQCPALGRGAQKGNTQCPLMQWPETWERACGASWRSLPSPRWTLCTTALRSTHPLSPTTYMMSLREWLPCPCMTAHRSPEVRPGGGRLQPTGTPMASSTSAQWGRTSPPLAGHRELSMTMSYLRKAQSDGGQICGLHPAGAPAAPCVYQGGAWRLVRAGKAGLPSVSAGGSPWPLRPSSPTVLLLEHVGLACLSLESPLPGPAVWVTVPKQEERPERPTLLLLFPTSSSFFPWAYREPWAFRSEDKSMSTKCPGSLACAGLPPAVPLRRQPYLWACGGWLQLPVALNISGMFLCGMMLWGRDGTLIAPGTSVPAGGLWYFLFQQQGPGLGWVSCICP